MPALGFGCLFLESHRSWNLAACSVRGGSRRLFLPCAPFPGADRPRHGAVGGSRFGPPRAHTRRSGPWVRNRRPVGQCIDRVRQNQCRLATVALPWPGRLVTVALPWPGRLVTVALPWPGRFPGGVHAGTVFAPGCNAGHSRAGSSVRLARDRVAPMGWRGAVLSCSFTLRRQCGRR
jgi:hypothetical protein